MSKSNKAGKARATQVASRPVAIQATAWSAPHQTPARAGVYEVRADDGTPHRLYCHWDGKQWSSDADNIEGASINYVLLGVRANQQVTWRGIVK